MEAKKTCYLILLIQFALNVNCYDLYKRYYEKCYMPTKDGTCCNVMARFSSESYAPIVSIINGICWYDAASKKDICDAGGNSDSQCLLNSQPYFGFAHPLGLMNGLVKSSQITFSNTLGADRNVRLFSTGLGWSVPDEGILKINFGRKIKITYIIFQNGGTLAGGTAYVRFKILTGSDDSINYQDLKCNSIFGSAKRKTCRHSLPRPLRTSVLSIKSKQPAETVKLEVGGMDYLEPDSLLRFDTILYRPGSSMPHFPDERGNYSVQTEIMEHRSLSKSVLLINDFAQKTTAASSHGANNNNRSIITACLADLTNCRGFTIAFWGKGPFSSFHISESINSSGFYLSINGEELSMNLEGVTKNSFSVPVCDCWKHFVIGVNSSTSPPVITFYENGAKKTSTSTTSGQTVADTIFTVSPVSNFRNLGIWNFTVNDEEAAEIFRKGDSFMDFKIPAFEDVGDWKFATTLCDSTNQGPCSDYSLSQMTGITNVPLQYNATITKMAFYDTYHYSCTVNPYVVNFRPDTFGLMAFQMDFTDIGMDIEALSSAFLSISFSYLPAFKNIEIYAARSYDYNDKYIEQCRFKFMNGDIKAGPIHWENIVSAAPLYRITTPNLSSILNPLIQGKGDEWTKKAVIILKIVVEEYVTLQVKNGDILLTYFDRTPERFLYADLISVPVHGQPLTYTTRYFPPVRKCLKFYYHMHGDGVGYLAVQFLQGFQLKEIFRLVGNQGSGWKSATMPLGVVDSTGPQFKIAFLASRGEKVSGSIAIDNIELLDTVSCEYEPMYGKPSYHRQDTISSGFELLKMEKALVLVPLMGDANRDLLNGATTGGDSLNFTLVRDIYGYPLRRNHLASDGLKIVLSSPVDISSHYSFSIQVKPEKMTSSVLMQIKITAFKHVVFSMEPDGNLSTSFVSNSSSQAMHTVSTSNVFANKSWVNLVVTYTNTSGILTVYTNATKVDSHSVQQYIAGFVPSVESFELAPNGESFGRPTRFNGYMTCFQFYDYELQPHQIKAIRICPDRISNRTCRTKCHDDGACDAITGKCICPHYASRYIDTGNCASKLYGSLYKSSSVSLLTFDGFYNLKKTIGNGKFFESSVHLYNGLEAGISSNAIFASFPGPVNLAICTTSTQAIPLAGIASCLLTKTCTTGFAVTLWIKPPLAHFVTQKDTVILEIGAFRVLYGSPYCNDTTSSSYKFQVENGSHLCTWAVRENCVSSQAWTQILFSFDAVRGKAFVLENGVMRVLRKVSCATATPLSANSKIGGSAMHVCIDNLVLWDIPLKTSFAMKVCCALSYCGMDVRPRKLNFQMTAYDEVLESLWALDDSGRVYHYSERAWVLVDKEMVHISAGINGVFGIGRDSKLYQREGVTSRNKTGTAWKILLPGHLWKKVSSGYKFGSIYLIDSNHRLHCLPINTMVPKLINYVYKGTAQDVSCAAGECWITSSTQKCSKIKIPSACSCILEGELSGRCTQAIVSKESYFAILQDHEIKRYKFQDGVLSADFVAGSIKHISFVHSEIWAITTSGSLKIIKNEGQDSFFIRHFNGKPFKGDQLANYWEYSAYHLAKVGNMCLRMLHTQLYIKENDNSLNSQKICDRTAQSRTIFSYSSDSTIHSSWGNKVLYLSTVGHITLITDGSYSSDSNYNVENGQFYFVTDSFKGPTSFISQRKQTDEFGGAVNVPITVEFKLNDYNYIKNFRDSQGFEAKMIYSKVKEELYQAFRDCPFYMDVHFSEIKFLKNIELWCHNHATTPTDKKDRCNRPLIVQFSGSLSFGHISVLERNVLSSEKFSGKETDCQGNSCWLRAIGGSYGYSAAHQPNIRLVRFSINGTSDVRAMFQYHEDIFCTGHTGYLINSHMHSLIDPNQKTNRSGRTNYSTTFFLKYPAYFAVNLSVIPLHVQHTALNPVSFSFITPETKPAAPPESVKCGPNGQHWIEFEVASIPWSGWNGRRLGYHVFYKKTNWNHVLNLDTGPFSPGNLTSYSFSNSSDLSDAFKLNLEKLDVFTKYEIFVGGYNSIGLGPLRRVVCRTTEGVPEVAPKNITVRQQTNSSVLITWDPVPDDPELWNSEDESSRTYKVAYYEYTAANSSITYFQSNTSMYELTNLEEGRGYKFVITAESGIGEGVASENYCIRMSETVPTAAPYYVEYWAKNASAIFIEISPIYNLYDENGVISHYRISLEEFNSYEAAPTSPTSQFFHSAYLERSSPVSFLKTRGNFTNVAVKCSSSFREVLGKTSQQMQVTIANLRYYTRYRVRASACTVVGCGPWSVSYGLIRTEEFHPTCPPANVHIEVKSSTSLEINWNHLEKSCTHGILTQYQLLVGEAGSFTHPTGMAAWPIFDESTYHERFRVVLLKDDISYFGSSAFLKKELHGLKKFFTYCVQINGFTVVGGGPKSKPTCGRTLQDYPDGPPTNLTVFSNSSTSLIAKLCLPAGNKANGIITHYTVFYSKYNTSDTQNITFPATCDNEICEFCAQTVINGLEKFTVYELKAAASTKIGMGPKSENYIVVRTLEDVPSSCVRNASSFCITDKDSFVAWRNAPIARLHGVFQGFKIEVTEQLQDEIILQRKTLFINRKLTQEVDTYGSHFLFNMAANVSNVYIRNKTDSLNKSDEYFYLNLIGLKAHAYYNVTLASCTTPGCGPKCKSVFLTKEAAPTGTVQELKASSLNSTSIRLSWQPLAVINQNGIIVNYEISWINTCLSGSNTNENSTEKCLLSLSHKTNHYGNVTISADKSSFVLTAFVPFTQYEFGVVAATSVGQGPRFMLISETPEDVPSAAPNFTEIYNTSSSSIMLKWIEIPYEHRNGIIIRHRLRFVESHGTENSSTHREVLVPASRDGFYKYEIVDLKRHTMYDILINGETIKGNGFVRNVSTKTGPYVNGHWSDWTGWTFCSAFCDGGIQFRSRSCTNPSPWNGGDDCLGSERENRTCNHEACSGKVLAPPNEDCRLTCSSRGQVCIVNLEITPYTDESQFTHSSTPCKIILNSWSSSTHTGLKENTGTCKGKPTWLECMEGNVKTTRRICNCYRAADLGYGQWSAWSFCSHTCGEGTKTRTRSCLLGKGKCDGPSYARLNCNVEVCPVNGAWGSWSEFYPCNKSCGYGYRNRYRRCDSPAPFGTGRDCYGPSTNSEGGCNPQICPVNGGWSKFGPYGMCSQPCGNGLAVRRRYCNSPKPSYGGKDCEGSNEDSKPCNPNPCSKLEVKCNMKIEMEWNFKYVYLESQLTRELVENIRKNLLSLYPNSSVIDGIRVHNFYKGSVVANFSIFFESVKNVEVVIFQDAISSQKKVGNLTVSELLNVPDSSLPNPPQNLSAIGLSPFSIGLSWTFNQMSSLDSNISSFFVLIRKVNSKTGKWGVIGVPKHLRAFNITDLQAVTAYRIRMSVAVTYSNGVGSEEVVGTTLEGAPDAMVQGLQLQAIQPTEVYLEWETMKETDYNGYPNGYVIRYKSYSESNYKEKLVEYGSISHTIKGLTPFTIYVFELMAYTAAGRGPPVAKVIKTLEGQPGVSPPNVRVEQLIATNQVIVRWDDIPDKKHNGIFQGFKLRYSLVSSGGRRLVPQGHIVLITTDKFTFEYVIAGLQSYSSYEITVSGFTNAGEGPRSAPITADTCKCPSHIFLNWFENRPYVTKTERPPSVEGIFAQIITDTIESSCGLCNGRKSIISTFQSLSGENPEKESELAVRAAIGKEYHISFPVRGKSEVTRYMGVNAFVTIVESNGVATVVRDEVDRAGKTRAAFESMINVWPMYIIIILTTLMAGIFIWFFEHLKNEDFEKGNYLKGILQGFWWAFISATTVGYGDITPKTIPGRIFGVIWTLVSLVLNGILIGSLTSSVTTMTLPPAVKLYGTTAAAITNSTEFELAIRRNSIIGSVEYATSDSVLDALASKSVDISLLDAFVAAANAENIKQKQLKVKEVIKTTSAFGVVLSHELLRLEDDFKSQITSKQNVIAEFVSNVTSLLKVSEEVKTVVLLLDPSSSVFWNFLEALAGLASILAVTGFIVSYYFKWRHHKRNRSIKPDRSSAVAASIDDDIQNFFHTVNKIGIDMDKAHRRKLQELAWLKKNYARYLERRALYRPTNPSFDDIHAHSNPEI